MTYQLWNLRNEKAPGPNNLTLELYKSKINSQKYSDITKNCLNKVFKGDIPEAWKTSNTILILKTNEATVTDFRHVALTDVAYKILMLIIKEKIYNIKYNKED